MRLLELMKQGARAGSFRFSLPPTRFANTPCWNWSSWCFLVWMGWNLRRPAIASCKGMTSGNSRANCTNTASRAGIDHRRLEHHTPDNIVEEIEAAIAHQTDFHQFMLYTPVPGLRSTRKWPSRASADRHGPPTFTGSSSSTSGTPHLREDSKRFWIGRSGAISKAMGQPLSHVPTV